MSLSRRRLLQLGLGMSQLALLPTLGHSPKGRAQGDGAGPSRLLTIYLSGGFTPQYFYAPMSSAEIGRHIMAPRESNGENVGYTPQDVIDVSAGGGGFDPIRIARTWNPDDPGSRAVVDGRKMVPLGYSWLEHDLFKQAVVIHGVDQGTAAHDSGYISAMCGVPGSEYRAPAVQSVFANHVYDRFANTRALPCVGLDARGLPNALSLPSRSAANFLPDLNSVARALSDRQERNPWWRGVNLRADVDDIDFDSAVVGRASRTAVEQRALAQARLLKGKSSTGTDAFLRTLHETYRGVSRTLAADVVSLIESTAGIEHLIGPASFGGTQPYGTTGGRFGFTYGLANEHFTDDDFQSSFDMALRLFKADLTSTIHLYMPRFYFDRHAGESGHLREFLDMRGSMDTIARLLGEMKLTPLPSGKTLLDDTLVMIFSEFGRSWASGLDTAQSSFPDDHWPTTSVTLVGGGLAGGRSIGGFDLDNFAYGPRGRAVDILEEDGSTNRRVPRAADVTATALRVLGLQLHDFFIPGGYGEILGVRAS